jgi:hypothetical protein
MRLVELQRLYESGGSLYEANFSRIEKHDDFGRYYIIDGAIDPNGNWKRLASIPDDNYVALYHATSRENAQAILDSGWNRDVATEKSVWKNPLGQFILLGSKNGLGTYLAHAGRDPVFLVFKARKSDLQPDDGPDWEHYRKNDRNRFGGRSDLPVHPKVEDTYGRINQVRVHSSKAIPIGIDEFR